MQTSHTLPQVRVSNHRRLIGTLVRFNIGAQDIEAFQRAAQLLFDQRFRMVEFYPSMPPDYLTNLFYPELDVYQVFLSTENNFQVWLKSWIGLGGSDVGEQYVYAESEVTDAFMRAADTLERAKGGLPEEESHG